MNENGLDQLEAEIVQRLEADPWFAAARQLPDESYVAIPVLAEEAGDLVTEVLTAIDRVGISVMVKVVEARATDQDSFGPVFDQIRIVVSVGENVLINRGTIGAPSATGTLKPAKATALKIISLLHHWKPDSLSSPLMIDAAGLGYIQAEEGGLQQYNASFRAHDGLSIELEQLELTVTETDGVVTMSCDTPGAAIIWTSNGKKPSPSVGTLYTGPIRPGQGTIIKARAWLAGYLTSVLRTLTVAADAPEELLPDADNSTVTGDGYVIADGSTATITVTINDQNGDPLEDRLVQLTADSGNPTIADPTLLTNPAGQVTFSVSSLVADETVVFSAKDIMNGGELEIVDTHSLDFIPVGTPIEGDDVEALFHFEGLDGSQNVTEEKGAIVTVGNDAQISVNVPLQYHGQNLLLDGDDYITIPWTYNPGSAGGFTVAWWQWLDPAAEQGAYVFKIPNAATGYAYGMEAGWVHRGNNRISLYAGENWGIAANRIIGAPIVESQWKHYAITKEGGTWRTFEDGILSQEWTNAADPGFSTEHSLRIAGGYQGARWIGRLEEVILASQPLWTASFTPPTLPYVLT